MHELTHPIGGGGIRRLLTLITFLFALSVSYAQNTITGTISEKGGVTIPGANVTIKGTTKGVTTDFDGKYAIQAGPQDILVVTFIGFKTQEIKVNNRTSVNVQLESESQSLDEIVVIGYGSQKKEDVNSSVSSIRSKDLENIKQVSVDQMIQGKAAGVQVSNNNGQPGSATSIRVRGTTSISGTNEPLYIIDGVPISGDAQNIAFSGRPISGNDFSSNGGAGNNAVSPLSMINPNDIQSIDILKDASATAIYGSRGANGVIIITTKSGKKGTGKVTYEGYSSIANVYKKLDVMNLQEYAVHQNKLTEIFGLDAQVRPEFQHPELLGPGTNWQDEVYQTGFGHSHQLSFSGANEVTSYYLSGGFLDQAGTVLGSGFKRYNMRLNLDSKVKDWLRVGGNITTGITNEKLTVNQSFNGLISGTLLMAPDVPVRNADGSFAGPTDGQTGGTYYNPVALALSRDNTLSRKNFLGNIYAEVNLFKGLKYRAEFGANTEFSSHTDYLPSYYWGAQYNASGDLNERRQNWYSTNLKNLLTYDRTFGKHHITLVAGQEANDSHWEGIYAYATGFQANDPHTINLGDPAQSTVSGYKGSSSLWSYFGRLIYDFDDRYSVSASFRGDRSSKFDPAIPNNQWGYFPAVSVGYKLSSEKFMEGTRDYVDNIKFRVGYGETGNQQIPNNAYAAMLNQQNSGLGSGFLVQNIPNPALTWESMNQTNIGLDFTLFKNRLSATIDWYKKESTGFLFQVPLPGYLTGGGAQYGGINSPYSNIGSMENTGYDVTLTYNTRGSGDFSYNATLVLSQYKNKLTEIQAGLPLTMDINTNGYIPVPVTNTLVGSPVGTFYGYKTDGLFTSLDQLNAAPLQFGQTVGTNAGQTYLGDVKYVDLNGDGVINELDKTNIGNPAPKFTFGFTNNFKYKNFDLSIFLQGVSGNDVLNLTERMGTNNATLYQNMLVSASDFYSADNPNSSNPRPINSLGNPNLEISDRYVEDGSYLRIQNVTLGYSLPTDIISKLKMSRVRLYATAQNLYTFTNYSGYDPEIGSFNQSALLSGIDNGRYPSPRTYTFGVNVEF
ncbi:SusC/RagA family TonB-linked outer membrane protein [Flavobacterium silvaticum]|uniref:TonB-dependent receptor n=1 Tax=Flavobacterium silvaticum TaxID=1852020 RepID=A0A972FZ01_9FLAO|nr:TonB-dependent receptor [Flavobacterium silvaticum]NMH27411.1 TonB-dependent receptor [Flavobacterium silvaticum]